uniref:Calcium-activated potassium channel subunit beta-4-like n=1 Tax=Gouania willdenowi TaxID=441366 RepID=A0A8C5GD99_GOUWI
MAKLRHVSYEFSEAEDKSIRLGLFLIISGILSLFILGFCWLSPALHSLRSTPINCTVVSVLRPEEMFECVFTCGSDCKGTSLYPCLQIFVNNSQSNTVALLHFDEQQLLLNPKCSYVPPCERDNQKNRASLIGQSFTCFFTSREGQREAHDVSVLLHCFLWPTVSLLLGTLIVLLTVCARSLAARAEALQKRRSSYEACPDSPPPHPLTTNQTTNHLRRHERCRCSPYQ